MKKITYPKQYSITRIYIKVPKLIDGKYQAVNVLENGKTKIESIYKPYNTEFSCQRACNIHNEFHNWNKSKVKVILECIGYEKS